MLASTFHDVAYPIEKIESWLGSFFTEFISINPDYNFYIGNLIPYIYYDFMKMICRWHKNPLQGPLEGDNILSMDWLFYNKVNSKLIEKDHGVLSALFLAHLLAIRGGFIGQEQGLSFMYDHLPACHAICIHHLDIEIDFTKYPLAFLLVLFDEIQDWGRPTKQTNRDQLYLTDIEIIDSEIPEINLVVAISEERTENLFQVLSSRLKTSGKIKVKIKNIDGKEILNI